MPLTLSGDFTRLVRGSAALAGYFATASWLSPAPALAQEATPPGPAPQTAPPEQPQPPPDQQLYPPYAQQAPPEQAPAPAPAQQPAPQFQQPASTYAARPPPTPAADAPTFGSRIKFPDFSARIDPLNWLLEGRLGLELELEVLEWLTVEAVPIFVTTKEPVLFPKRLTQESNGAGPMAGASLGVGFWLGGNSFNGTVLRAAITNYGYKYRGVSPVEYEEIEIGDRLRAVTQTERRLSLMIGSGRTWGAFTIAGGFGLEYEMNQQFSCVVRDAGIYTTSTNRQVCKDRLGGEFDDSEQFVSLRPDASAAENINGSLAPFSFAWRLSLGVVLDD